MATVDRRPSPVVVDEWDDAEATKVEPRREFFGEFTNLDKGDELSGWIIGTRQINGRTRYYLHTTDDRVLILPDHALLTACLEALPQPPVAVKIRNTGRRKLASGRVGFSYEVLVFRYKAPPEVLESLKRLAGEEVEP